jgi:hypothetical protein
MAEFQVTPQDVRQLAHDLERFGDRGGETKAALDNVGEGATGHEGLADAVSKFTDNWDYSIKKIAEKAAAISGKVGAAADMYQETDTTVADGYRGE